MISFSIVIPVYNGQKHLELAINSALNQTRQADEVVIYDDCSTDSSVQVATAFGDRVRLVRGQDGPSGFVNGWNKSIAHAKGDYISILHQDDLLYPDFLKAIESAILGNPDCRHVFAVCDYIDEKSAIMDSFPLMDKETVRYSGREYVKAYQKTYGSIPHIHRCPGVVTHRSIFEKDKCLYREQAGHMADDDFFYRVAQYTDVVGLLTPHAAYRQHAGSATSSLDHLRMVRRLAMDYLYQVRQWHDSDFLELPEKRYFEHWALKYIFSMMFQALKCGDRPMFNEARTNYQDTISVGLLCEHGFMLSRLRYLLVLEKMIGFRLLSAIAGLYA
jgi:glycosyltransferase involved in cell wall biosynthesis